MPVDELFANECLAIHNEYRSKHGASQLTLNNDLSKLAQEWAEKLAQKEKLEHSPNNKYGENVYFYYHSDKTKPTAKMAVDSWYKEIEKYKFGSKDAQKGTGHFTQVVWKDTKHLGIGIAQSKNGKYYVVAEYDPSGNFSGKYADNVAKPT